eukprot:scaffold279066_cov15-Tisochrysis_lutea.AAC.1
MFHSSNCLIDGEAGDGKGGVVKAVAVPKQALSINRPDTMAAMSALPRALSTVPKVRRAGVWLGADTVCPCWECKEKPHRASTDVLHICKLMFDCACETYVQSQPRSLSAALPEQVLRSKAVPALARPAVPIRQRQLSVRVQAGPAEVSAFSNEQKVRRGAKDSFDYRVFFKQGCKCPGGQCVLLRCKYCKLAYSQSAAQCTAVCPAQYAFAVKGKWVPRVTLHCCPLPLQPRLCPPGTRSP